MASQIKKSNGQKNDHERIQQSIDPSSLHHQIEIRAHEIWLSSGAGHGNDVAHWIQAESDVLASQQ